MTDKFQSHTPSLTAPAGAAAPVTPDDVANLTFASRAIYVGTAGDLTVEMVDSTPGSTVTLVGVQPGILYPLRVRKVLASGTTATGLVSFW